MRTTIEHERKLEAPAGWQLPPLAGEELEPRVFTSVYHDTPALSLARAGITLRRRTERGKSVWQLKLPRDDARAEIEEPGGPAGPPESLHTLLRAHVRRDAVVPVAELRTRRHGRLVVHAKGTAEVTFDDVRIMDAQRVREEFTEIEVELRDGDPSAVKAIAKELERAGAQAAPLTPKLFRALDLNGSAPAKTPFEGFRTMLGAQLDAILGNDPGVRLGGDDENVHKMRVATRRSRALLRAARPLYVGDVTLLNDELKWLAGVLGDVRDLDVLLAHLSAQADTLAPADAAAAHRLLRTMERTRSRRRRTLLKALDSPRYGALLDLFEQTLAAVEPSDDETPLRELARQELKKLRRDAKQIADDAPDDELHALRKRGKRVRYAYELAGDDKVVSRAKAFQDVLGEHQDSVIAEEQLRALASTAPAEQAVAAGLLIAAEHERRAEARAGWRDVWKQLDRT
jgi:CHAD domain-containing protein